MKTVGSLQNVMDPEETESALISSNHPLSSVVQIRIRFLFDPWLRDQGWIKKSGSGLDNPDNISYGLETIFGGLCLW
jgi:hypothetical protein